MRISSLCETMNQEDSVDQGRIHFTSLLQYVFNLQDRGPRLSEL